ncbi:MAG: hypothetical protein COA70_08635 [Planctomycetota bacterium]|nr:MAG: hypothetical protein COA70_08635 [Planctomycetota bacterium]
MIILSEETVIPLTEAPDYLPKRRGKKVHISTLFRWAQKGVGGTQLETIKVGGTRCTSLEALERFVEHKLEPSSGQRPLAGRANGRGETTARVLRKARLDKPGERAKE